MCIFIHNPNAGKGKVKKRLPFILRRLEEIFGSVKVMPTAAKGDAVRLAKEACGACDYLVFAGGDGTFNEIVNGIAEEESRPVLGYLPQGTTNDMAANYRLPKSLKRALNIIAGGNIIDADIIKAVSPDSPAPSYAAYVVAGGSLATISYATPQKRKKLLGKFAYFFAALSFWSNPKPASVECAEPPHPGLSLLIALKSSHVAGFKLNRGFAPDDGRLQVIIIRRRGKNRALRFLRIIAALLRTRLSRRKGDFERKGVSRFSAERVVIESQNVNWSLDGEEGSAGKLELSVLNRHIKLLVR